MELDDKRGGARIDNRDRDRANTQRNTGPARNRYDDKPHKDRNNAETKERSIEDRMPKLKEQEAPNFAASNKFAFLQTEDVSD